MATQPQISPAARPAQSMAVTLIGLALALGVPEAVILSGGHAPVLHEIIFWTLTLVLLLYVAFVEKRPLSSIGFRKPTVGSLGWGVLAAVVTIIGIGILYGVVFRLLHLSINNAAMAQILAYPRIVRLAIVLRAGIFEEIVYRGYAIERLTELTHSRALAAALSWAAFTVAHLSYWGLPQLIIAGFAGLVLTALYLWRRDLPSNMLAHFLTDGAGFLLR